jgi:hypothetical protein
MIRFCDLVSTAASGASGGRSVFRDGGRKIFRGGWTKEPGCCCARSPDAESLAARPPAPPCARPSGCLVGTQPQPFPPLCAPRTAQRSVITRGREGQRAQNIEQLEVTERAWFVGSPRGLLSPGGHSVEHDTSDGEEDSSSSRFRQRIE